MHKLKFRSRPTRIACVQHPCDESIESNIETALALIKDAVRQDASIVCLQELFATRYFAGANLKKEKAIEEFSETLNGPINKILSRTAKNAHIVLIGGSFYERGTGKLEGKYFNSSPIFDSDGTLVDVHRKAHIPCDPGYMEKNFFDVGNRRVTVTETSAGKIGVGICFDQWFPEVAVEAANKGAAALFYPTAIGHTNDEVSGYIPGDSGLWNTKLKHVLAGQAANNHLYVGIANRIGVEGDTRFFGESAIYDHIGDHHGKLGQRYKGIAIADCDLGIVPILRDAWGFHKARRTDISDD